MLPKKIMLTYHAIDRLKQRKNINRHYNIENILNSNCKWYTLEDLKETTGLYNHAKYVCRKSKDLDYITDGEIEVIYNKGTGVAITILEVKEKFLPVTQHIKT